jgi:ABC-type transport system involved in multi-copper enzyme maturation permease subunit
VGGAIAVLSIAGQTFTEARRNKVFYSLFAFAMVVVLDSVLFTEVTITTVDRMLKDTGIAAINLFAVMLTVFTGVGVINREVDKRSLYAILAKPIPRWTFIVGKYLGLLAIALVTSGLMFLGLLLVMRGFKTPIHSAVFAGYAGVLAEIAVLGAFAVLCSSFTNSVVSAFLCIAVFASGHLSSELYFYANKSSSALYKSLGHALYYLVPNLERFNLKLNVTYDVVVSGSALLSMAGYAMAYIAAFLIASIVVFSNRDFR